MEQQHKQQKQKQNHGVIDIISSSDEEEEDDNHNKATTEASSHLQQQASHTVADRTTITIRSSDEQQRKRKQEEDKIRLGGERLLMGLAHAWVCTSMNNTNNNKGQCSWPQCKILNRLSRHIVTCRNLTGCPVPYCATSKALLMHYRSCCNRATTCKMCRQVEVSLEKELAKQQQQQQQQQHQQDPQQQLRLQKVTNETNTNDDDDSNRREEVVVDVNSNIWKGHGAKCTEATQQQQQQQQQRQPMRKESLSTAVRLQMLYKISHILHDILPSENSQQQLASDSKFVSFIETELITAAKNEEEYGDRSTLKQRIEKIFHVTTQRKQAHQQQLQEARNETGGNGNDDGDSNAGREVLVDVNSNIWKSQQSKLNHVAQALRTNMVKRIAKVIYYQYRDLRASCWYNCTREELLDSVNTVENAIFAKCSSQQHYLILMNNETALKTTIDHCHRMLLQRENQNQDQVVAAQHHAGPSVRFSIGGGGGGAPANLDVPSPADGGSSSANGAMSNVIEDAAGRKRQGLFLHAEPDNDERHHKKVRKMISAKDVVGNELLPMQVVDVSDDSLPEQQEQHQDWEPQTGEAQEDAQGQEQHHQIEDDSDRPSAGNENKNRLMIRVVGITKNLEQNKGAKKALTLEIMNMVQEEVNAAVSKVVADSKCDRCADKSKRKEPSAKQTVKEWSRPRMLTDAEELVRTQQIFLKRRELEKLRTEVVEAKISSQNLDREEEEKCNHRRKLRVEYF